MVIISPSGASYEVGKKVAESKTYRLYLCRPQGIDAQDHLLQVASTIEYNGALDRATYILGKLLEEAERLEEEYAKVKSKPNHFLNYQLCFPEIVDTFVSTDQGNRRVNILRFRGVDDVRTVVPLETFVRRDQFRVDLRTSVWMMGKLLKILAFVHESGVMVGDLALGNILIQPDQHYVIIFNWANAQVVSDGISREIICEEIERAAQSVIEVLGCVVGGNIPDDGSAEYRTYAFHLQELAKHGARSALNAHEEFYALVDSLWPRGFHKFTALPR